MGRGEGAGVGKGVYVNMIKTAYVKNTAGNFKNTKGK